MRNSLVTILSIRTSKIVIGFLIFINFGCSKSKVNVLWMGLKSGDLVITSPESKLIALKDINSSFKIEGNCNKDIIGLEIKTTQSLYVKSDESKDINLNLNCNTTGKFTLDVKNIKSIFPNALQDDAIHDTLTLRGFSSKADTNTQELSLIFDIDPPEISSQFSPYIAINEDQPKNIKFDFSNERKEVTILPITPPLYGVLNCQLSNCTYTPNLNFNGIDSAQVRFIDFAGNQAETLYQLNFTINAVNDAPTLASLVGNCSATISEGYAWSCVTKTSDPDLKDQLLITLEIGNVQNFPVCKPSSILNLSSSGTTLFYTPEIGASDCSFSVRAKDPAGGFSEWQTFNLKVIPQPAQFVSSTITDKSVNEESTSIWDLNSNREGNGSVYSLLSSESNPDCSTKAAELSINSADGNITFTPIKDFSGQCFTRVKFEDSYNSIAYAEFKVSVINVNDQPIINTSNCGSMTFTQDQTSSCTPSALDPDVSDTISWQKDNTSTCGTWLKINATTGVISGTPGNADVVDCSFKYKAIDNSNQTNSTSLIKEVAVTVNNTAPTLVITNVTNINEDAPLAIIKTDSEIQANDEGQIGTTYSLSTATDPQCSDPTRSETLSIDANTGEILFKPKANYNGICNVKVNFNDGKGASVNASFQITVNNVNDKPVLDLSSCIGSLNEDSNYNCNLSSSSITSDPDINDTKTWTVVTSTNCPWLSLNSTSGILTGTPHNENVGNCSITLKVNDGTEDSISVVKNITVTNITPTLSITTGSLNEDEINMEIKTDAHVQASDEGQGSTTYSLIATSPIGDNCNSVSYGTATINAVTGSINFSPKANWYGTCKLKVSFNDGKGGVVSSQFDVVTNPINDAPTISASSSSVSGPDNISKNVTLNISDLESSINCSTITFNSSNTAVVTNSEIIVGSGSALANASAACVVTLTPIVGSSGQSTINFSIPDPTNSSIVSTTSVLYQVAYTNKAPTIGAINAQTFSEDTTIDIPLTLADTDNTLTCTNTNLTWSSTNSSLFPISSGVSFSGAWPNCIATLVPAANLYGVATITISITDGDITNSQNFNTTVSAVNDNPTINLGGSCLAATSVNEDATYSCTNAAPIDPDTGNTFTWSIVNGPHTCSWANINSSGTVTGVPSNSNVGSCKMAFKVTDNTGLISNTISYSVSVINTNPTLVINNIGSGIIFEDCGSESCTSAFTLKTAGEVDADDETGVTNGYSLTTPSGDPCSDHGALSLVNATSGELSFLPSQDYFGTCFVKLTFNDGKGGAISSQFSVVVTSVNDAPQITASCPTTIVQDSNYYCAPTVIDIDSSSFTWSFDGVNNTCNWLSIDSSTGVISATPNNLNVNPNCNLKFKVNDSSSNSVVSSFSVTVTNIAPTLSITIPNPTISEDPTSPQIILTDAQVTSSEEDAGVTYTIDNSTGSTPTCDSKKSSLAINTANGEVTFKPALNYFGNCYIKIIANDNKGASANDEIMVSINPVNDIPTISGTVCSTVANQNTAYSCSTLTASDIENSPLTWTLATGVGKCNWLTIDSSTGSISGTPTNTDIGSCSVNMTVSDGSTNTNNIFTLTVNNQLPTLTISDATISEDSALTIIRDAEVVQANEEGLGTTTYGFDHTNTTGEKCSDHSISLSINSTSGEITYQPTVNYTGNAATHNCNIRVKFNDGHTGGNVTTEFAVSFNLINDAPVINSHNCSTTASSGTSYTCSAVATDIELQNLSWSLDSTNTCLWATMNASTGVINGTPPTGGSCNLVFKVTDSPTDGTSAASSSLKAIAITIEESLPIPNLITSSIELYEGTSYEFLIETNGTSTNPIDNPSSCISNDPSKLTITRQCVTSNNSMTITLAAEKLNLANDTLVNITVPLKYNTGSTTNATLAVTIKKAILRTISSSQDNLVLTNLISDIQTQIDFAKSKSPNIPMSFKFVINNGVVIGSENVLSESLHTGHSDYYPTGSWIKLEIDGKVLGKGGNGGRGASIAVDSISFEPVSKFFTYTALSGQLPPNYAQNGENGGLALKIDSLNNLNIDLEISSTGQIAGGGGGGGGGGASCKLSSDDNIRYCGGASGGGGAGSVVGTGGPETYGYQTTTNSSNDDVRTPASDGTINSGGSPSDTKNTTYCSVTSSASNGGFGGNPGSDGANGQRGTVYDTCSKDLDYDLSAILIYGSGGSAGDALQYKIGASGLTAFGKNLSNSSYNFKDGVKTP